LFLTIQDSLYIEQTIIDGSTPSNQEIGSVVTFDCGEDSTSVLYGFTIESGKGNIFYYMNGAMQARCGGGIFCIDSSPIISYNIIQENILIDEESLWTQGGGIFLNNSSVQILNNEIVSNELPGYGNVFDGGGIYGRDCDNILIKNNRISNNSCTGEGGGICIGSSGQTIIKNNIITGNNGDGIYTGESIIEGNYVAQNNGCGIYVGNANTTIKNNVIENNGVGITCSDSNSEILENVIKDNHNNGTYAGGIQIGDWGLAINTIIKSNFIHNNSGHYGGGISCTREVSIINNMICNNSSTKGGAIYAQDTSEITFINNTICNNFAESKGGGVYCREDARFVNNIVWGNIASEGKQVYIDVNAQPEFYYCNVEGSADDFGGPGSGINFNMNLFTNNISSIPFFLEPTQGIGTNYSASNSDWTLLPVTESINSGYLDTLSIYLPEYDLNGNLRVFGDQIDIGAYETQTEMLSCITSFEASNNYIGLMPVEFKTSFEINLLGFNVYHNTTTDLTNAILVNDTILLATNTSVEQIYYIDDFVVEPGNNNYFWLEAIALNGEIFLSTFVSKESAQADFIAEPTWGQPPLIVNFTDTSIGDIMSWEWDFENDGIIDSYDQNPSFIYNNQGTFSVHFTIIDSLENEHTIIKENFINSYYVSAENDIPSYHQMLLNFPNPFNPSTTIEFSIPDDSKVELTVFNVKGQEIKILANSDFTEGNHSILWNGDDNSGKFVSSGIYYFRLNVNGSSEAVKKCLLLK